MSRTMTMMATVLSVAFLLPATALAQLGVSPPIVELDLDDGPANGSLRVFNFGADTARVEVTVHNWDLDDNSKIELVESDESSLDQWIIVNPLRFDIPPGGSQAVRFAVRPQIEPQPGEHRAIIYFGDLPRFRGSNQQVKVGLQVGAAIYARVGEIIRTGVLHDIGVTAEHATFDVSSDGNAHVRILGQYAVWEADAYPGAAATAAIEDLDRQPDALPEHVLAAASIPSIPILPGTRRTIDAAFGSALPPGRYVLDVNAEVAGEPIDRGIAFDVDAADATVGTAPPVTD